jgi:hypothetical protein
MSASNLINSATGKIYDQYIPQGGGVNLTRGQLISAVADGTEVAVSFPRPQVDATQCHLVIHQIKYVINAKCHILITTRI